MCLNGGILIASRVYCPKCEKEWKCQGVYQRDVYWTCEQCDYCNVGEPDGQKVWETCPKCKKDIMEKITRRK